MRSLAHLKEKAIELRTLHNMSLDDICARLKVSRTTVYYWIKDIPITRTEKQHAGQKAGTAAMSAKYAARRQQVYDAAYLQAAELLMDLSMRDFVVLYLAEGYRKNRNVVSFSNSSPQMVRFAHSCMRQLATNLVFHYSFQYHADQDPEELKQFWASCLGVSPDVIRPIPKTNSGHLKGRRFACAYGVFQVRVGDTAFRARLQALMDAVQEQWVPDAD
jgi:AcrR family transcriptional regulator